MSILPNFGVLFCVLHATVIASVEEDEEGRSFRRSDFPSFDSLLKKKANTLQIQNTDCKLGRSETGCIIVFEKASGSCYFNLIMTQLFPAVDLEATTKKFLSPAKFLVEKFTIDNCDGEKHQTVEFKAASVESIEMAPQYLTLASASELMITWKYNDQMALKTLSIEIKGKTSVGSNTGVPITLKKKSGEESYDLTINMASLRVNEFLEKFSLSEADMIDSNLQTEKNALGLPTLNMQSPKIKGIFSPGDGFEITVTGEVNAPQLAADATSFYLIIQDFKKSSQSEGDESTSYDKPIGGIFAVYSKSKVPKIVMQLSNEELPKIQILKEASEVAITLASKPIIFLNSEELRNLISKFVPVKGLDLMEKGLTVMHYAPNSNNDIKDQDDKMVERILFRCDVSKDELKWSTPQVIETSMKEVSRLALSGNGVSSLAIPAKKRVIYDSISFIRENKNVELACNLTEPVQVLENKLVNLLNTTIILVSSRNEAGKYQEWRMAGRGKEVILDELVDIVIDQREHRTYVTAEANVYSMATLRNRTRATYLPEDFASHFSFPLNFSLLELNYEASFERSKVLKFKGVAIFDSHPKIEILYFLSDAGPELKVGLLFRNKFLHDAVNSLYGLDKMQSNWMKFEKIAIVMKKKQKIEKGRYIEFDHPAFKPVDASTESGGISLRAENLDLRKGDEDIQMCNFLRLHFGESLSIMLEGQILVKKFKLHSTIGNVIHLADKLRFGSPIAVKMKMDGDGDRIVLESDLYIHSTGETFPAKIYDDGSNKLILNIGDSNSESAELLRLAYARLSPMQSRFSIPSTEKLKHLELKSRLHVGSIQEEQISYSGGTGRQFIYFDGKDGEIGKRQFIGEKTNVHLSSIEKAFGLPASGRQFNNAKFKGQSLVAYNSVDKIWDVPDVDVRVRKGLHFYGTLELNTGEEYSATVSLKDSMQLETRLRLPPLRYGQKSMKRDADNYEDVKVFLFKQKDGYSAGPALIVNGQTEYLEGYCQTIGIEGPFQSSLKAKQGNHEEVEISLQGSMYNEIEDVNVLLTADATAKAADYVFKYKLDLTSKVKEKATDSLRNALAYLKKEVLDGKEEAVRVLDDIQEDLSTHKKRKARFESEIESLQKDIQKNNAEIDTAIFDISTNCIDRCKTVSMPGMGWKQGCDGDDKHSIKCMEWSEDKEKAVNVICLVKCEAKKFSSSSTAYKNLDNIRVKINRYREIKVLSLNEDKMVALIVEAMKIATETISMLDSQTNIEGDIGAVLERPSTENLATISKVSIDEYISELNPPCLPFKLNFVLNTQPAISRDGTSYVCFNGEFYKNLGLEMLKMAYPQVDGVYKALTEAKLRFVRINEINKSLQRVINDINAEQSTSHSTAQGRSDLQDALEQKLMGIASRNIPKFCSKSDHTKLGFIHYSPWSVAKRSNSVLHQRNNLDLKPYNISALSAQSVCHQSRGVVKVYKEIADSLAAVSKNYEHGKLLFTNTRDQILRQLNDSHMEIINMMNKTALSPVEKKEMMYWYAYTKAGMEDYIKTFANQINEHNVRGLQSWRSEIASRYGNGDIFNQLRSVGHEAYARSNIENQHKKAHIDKFNRVGKALKNLLSKPETTLEDVRPVVTDLPGEVAFLQRAAVACY